MPISEKFRFLHFGCNIVGLTYPVNVTAESGLIRIKIPHFIQFKLEKDVRTQSYK